MPPQSPAMGLVSGLLLVAPPIAGVVVRREVDRIARRCPCAWRALPWFCTYSEAFCSLRVEPAVKTRVVLNGTDALPLVTPLLLPAGAWSTKARLGHCAGDRVALGNARQGHDDDRTAEPGPL